MTGMKMSISSQIATPRTTVVDTRNVAGLRHGARLGSRRRGVLLLVILALLAMFGLIAVAFVVLTGQAKRSARSVQRMELVADPPEKLLQQAAMQVLRGPSNVGTSGASVMRAHSLLEDMYGNEYVTGTVNAASVVAGFNQLVNVTVSSLTKNGSTGDVVVTNIPTELARHAGSVLTITSVSNAISPTVLQQALVGQSTRIVKAETGAAQIQIVGFPNGAVPPSNAEFVINSVPFAGTGFGFNPITARLNLGYNTLTSQFDTSGTFGATNLPVALLPNLPLSNYQSSLISSIQNYRGNPPGGTNPDYTAADYQHILLAAQVANTTAPGGVQTLPSMHRPALARYWLNELGAANWSTLWTTSPQLCRNISLRPIGAEVGATADHPNFNGSNPNFNPTWDGATPGLGQWDVDNDGDGVPDSVWVDLGMPARPTSDGRMVKPIFAFLCKDLDGRLNLNAHGSLAQLSSAYGTLWSVNPQTGSYLDVSSGGGALQFALGGPPALPINRRGMGLGAAEINLTYLLSANYCWYLFAGNSVTGIEGRYGRTSSGATPPIPGPGYVNPMSPLPDPLTANKWFSHAPSNSSYYWNFLVAPGSYVLDAFGGPPDALGVGAVGLDLAGRPIYAGIAYQGVTGYQGFGTTEYLGMGSNIFDWTHYVNLPYAINLGLTAGRGLAAGSSTPDNPFSPGELERILRPYDRDAPRLPDRLARLTSPTGLPQDSLLIPKRSQVTTDSWDVPRPNLAIPKYILTYIRTQGDLTDPTAGDWIRTWIVPRNIADILTAKYYYDLRVGGQTAVNAMTAVQAINVASIASALFPPELLAGLKMDINRPFGNGRDDPVGSGNGVVDEPLPAEADPLTLYTSTSGTPVSPGFSYDPTGTLAANSFMARHLEARQLYTLAMLLADPAGLLNHVTQWRTGRGYTTTTQEDVARYVAQWAVNVVDFRDRDSIMTPFEFDLHPFTDDDGLSSNGTWDVDGLLGTADDAQTYRGLVWGCERPELLMNETLALHERRTQDLTGDGPMGNGTRTTDIPADNDFDQQKKPQGSLFIELYNPWTDQEPPPQELYATSGLGITGVELSKAVSNYPVWRIAIVEGNPTGSPALDPEPDDGSAAPLILRSIYFTNPSAAVGLDASDGAPDRFWSTADALNPILLPSGRYAVIGSADSAAADTTYLGRLTSVSPDSATEPSDLNQTRQIRLGTPATGTLVHNNLQQIAALPTGSPDVSDSVLQNSVRIPIYTPRRLNISDPGNAAGADGYPNYTGVNVYSPPLDTPLDYNRTDSLLTMRTAVKTNGTTRNIVIAHLQRLANPLLPWNSVTNPYRTVDSMPVDLIAFNGWADDSSEEGRGNVAGGTMMVASHQRGEPTNSNPTPIQSNLWSECLDIKQLVVTCLESTLSTPPPATNRFPYVLHHTLGFMNRSLGFPDQAVACARRTTMPYLGDPDISGTPVTQPFSWLTWNNRPFVSQLELTLVPAVKSSDLPFSYNLLTTSPAPYTNPLHPFPHMLNFFYSESGAGSSSELHRLFEYLNVPSQFACAEIQADPTAAAGSTGHSFHPPFNRISTYREPGRMNLNTIYTQQEYEGLMNGFPGMSWTNFLRSRRNDTNGILDMPAATCPTEFARPFRSGAGGQMVPSLSVLTPDREVNATLLREDPVSANRPLFEYQGTPNPTPPPLLLQVDDPDRNPFFRYQGLQRLGNLVTTRSNVYAVWITVGYFEVTPCVAGYNPAIYPDGYQLGRELGVDSGEVERHRAFYIFDRTIPVGFQRGQDLNVEKAILTKRFIE